MQFQPTNWTELRRAAVTNVRGHGHTWRDLQHFHLQIQLVLRVGEWVGEWLVVVVVKFLSCPTCIVVSGSFSPAAAATLLFSVFCVVDCFVLVAQWPDQWHIQWTWTVKVCNSTGCEFYANCSAEQMSHDYWTVMDGWDGEGRMEWVSGGELNSEWRQWIEYLTRTFVEWEMIWKHVGELFFSIRSLHLETPQ